MVLLARTTPLAEVAKKSDGMSVFIVDLREAIVHGTLHLVGMDHETDQGEMLAVQSEILT